MDAVLRTHRDIALVTSGQTVSLARPIPLTDGSVERGVHEVTQRPDGGARDFVGLGSPVNPIAVF